MSGTEDPPPKIVKEELDGDAASALMALATNSEIKSGDEDSVQKEEEAAEVPNQPSAVLRTSVESEPLESNAIATRPQASMKFPSKASLIDTLLTLCVGKNCF
eukprot:scaffold6454_cov267-Chaetoceros_neogracile.AAC.23